MNNPLNNYHFVVATQHSISDFREKSQISIYLEKTDFIKNSSIIYNNKDGLPKVYNKFISETYKDKRVIFVHDDVLIEDLFLIEKLDLAFEKFDIIGLAGSKKVDLTRPAAWHLMSDRNDYIGEVAHSKDKVAWTTSYGPTNSRALVLDGLFLAVNVSKLLENKVEFDENFDFHHYDISFCLRANSNKLKMGVAPIKVTHFGLGDSMNTPEWHESEQRFKKLYQSA